MGEHDLADFKHETDEETTDLWILEDDHGSIFVYNDLFKDGYNLKIFDTIEDFRKKLLSVETYPNLIIVDLMIREESFLEMLTDGFFSDVTCPFLVVSGFYESKTSFGIPGFDPGGSWYFGQDRVALVFLSVVLSH